MINEPNGPEEPKDSALFPYLVYNGDEGEGIMNPKCYICGKECENQWGNNPYPLVKDENARCCNVCNDEVIQFRLLLSQIHNYEEAIEIIRLSYLNTVKNNLK